MATQPIQYQDEIKRLQRCINDLVSVVALPAIWSPSDRPQIVSTLLKSLLGMLDLDLAYVRLKGGECEPTSEALVTAPDWAQLPLRQINEMLERWPARERQSLLSFRRSLGGREVRIVVMRLGLEEEIGLLVAGSQRPEFPEQTEKLLLNVAANQAYVALQEARLLTEQKHLTNELDRRVTERTTELAHANEELRKQISERLQAEEQLRRSEAFLAEGQHLARIGNFSWLVATDEIRWSEQMYRIFEFEPNTIVTLERIGARVHPEDTPMLFDMIERARAGVSDFEYAHRLLMPDRRIKYLHLIAHRSCDERGRIEYMGAVQDVTQRRASEDALAKARSELAQGARINSLAMLTASIAHEVNQPLSGIITNASTNLRMLASDPPNVEGARETARRTIRDGNRAAEVITRLRNLFTKKEVCFELLDLNDAAKEVVALSLGELQRNRISLRIELADELPRVNGDRVQIQQVILNLLRNGSEAMSNIDNRARELSIKTQLHEKEVHLAVKDAGTGFSPDVADRLFEAFYTTKADGMGIGLSVSRSIIEGHHGRMWAALNYGPGATFSFSIPVGNA
jgi:signal transduction histidine kinase